MRLPVAIHGGACPARRWQVGSLATRLAVLAATSQAAPPAGVDMHLVQPGLVATGVGTNSNGYNSEPNGRPAPLFPPAVEDLQPQGRRGAPALVPGQIPARAASVGACTPQSKLSGFTWLNLPLPRWLRLKTLRVETLGAGD